MSNNTQGQSMKKLRCMNVLMMLRKICNHPVLFDDIFDEFYTDFKSHNYWTSTIPSPSMPFLEGKVATLNSFILKIRTSDR